MTTSKLAVSNGDFGNSLVEALGLRGRSIVEVHLHVVSGAMVKLDTVEYVKADDGETVTAMLQQYVLVPVGEADGVNPTSQ